MKKFFMIGACIAILAASLTLGSCKGNVYELCLDGYEYQLTSIRQQGVPNAVFLADPYTSTITFSKDGSSVTWVYDENKTLSNGTFSISNNIKKLTLKFDKEYSFSISDNGGTIVSYFNSINDNYQANDDGVYELIYKLK